MCLDCGDQTLRTDLQTRLQRYNQHWTAVSTGSGPDADEFLKDEDTMSFQVPPCASCGGVLKPDVVYFGDNVKKEKVSIK